MVSLGGRIAEELIFDDITTGASSDIQKATKAARRMVTRFGMSQHIGVINYDESDDEVFIGLSEIIRLFFSVPIPTFINAFLISSCIT